MTRGVWGEREERWLRERYAYEHAHVIDGQDPYRNQVLAMLAMLLAFASDFKEAQ